MLVLLVWLFTRWPPSQEPLSTLVGSPEEPVPRGDRGSARNSQPDLEENIFPVSPSCDLVVNKAIWLLSNAPKGPFWLVSVVAALEGPELQGWRPGRSWARQGWDGADGLTSCPWAGRYHTQPHGLKLPWGGVFLLLAEYGCEKRKVLCYGCHVCACCQHGPWGTGGFSALRWCQTGPVSGCSGGW